MFDSAIDEYHRLGNVAGLGFTFTNLAVFFERLERPEIATTVYGASTHYRSSIISVVDLANVVDHLRSRLGDTGFDEYVANGVAMELADAVQYAATSDPSRPPLTRNRHMTEAVESLGRTPQTPSERRLRAADLCGYLRTVS